ncbi:transposase [Psychromonas sp. MME2]|uniref:transposase n=1 Tax=Psychromonas sp. MME2 TaxID=3231033 RepID=UPI00339C833E
MANYKPDLSCQSKFIPIDFAQQILPGTFEYALSHIVDKHLDLSTFDDWYNNDNGGAAAYPPSVMLKIILLVTLVALLVVAVSQTRVSVISPS